MLADLSRLAPDHFADTVFDVCICGAGPAGLSLAQRLSGRFAVALIEGGDLEYSDESQDLYRGTVSGLPYYDLDACRLRQFGGSTGHWGGWCNRMEARAFTPDTRIPGLPRMGWPITRADLDPYADTAAAFLGADFGLPENRVAWIDAVPGFHDAGYAFSEPPARLGETCVDAIRLSPSIRCFYNANLTDITLYDDLAQVRHAELRDYQGNAHRLRARVFVLAAGGIENARILLCARRQLPAGLGNDRGLVGRFFTEHPRSHTARFLLEDAVKRSGALEGLSIVTIDDAALEGLIAPTFKVIVRGRHDRDRDGDFRRRMRDLMCATDSLHDLVVGAGLFCPLDGTIELSLEQYPNPASRLTLGDELDRFGNPRVDLHWALFDFEREGIREATVRFAQAFATAGLGRVRLDDWLLEETLDYPALARGPIGGPHHMGTTTMSDDPATGVVDRDCRVFGLSNLYAVGSSVFPSNGYGNPTLTIVQLAQRLADHLNARL